MRNASAAGIIATTSAAPAPRTRGFAAAAFPICTARAKRGRMRKLLPWYALALLVVLLDQLTKYWVSASFHYGEARAYGGGFFLLVYDKPGAAVRLSSPP